jgi:hypothetical protein
MAGMRAHDYAPIERLDAAPTGPYVPMGKREEALVDAFRGVDRGANDDLIITWLARHLDNATLRTVVSLIERARCAATDPDDSVDGPDSGFEDDGVERRPDDGRQRPDLKHLDLSAPWAAGNSGPGYWPLDRR